MTPPSKLGATSSSTTFSFDWKKPTPSPQLVPGGLFDFHLNLDLSRKNYYLPSLGFKAPLLWRPAFSPKNPIVLAQAGGPPTPTPNPTVSGPSTGSTVPKTKPTPPPAPAPATPPDFLLSDAAYKITRDVFLLIESMDAHGEKMIANGGQDTCRYAEFLLKSQLKSLGDKCSVIFQPNTHSNVDLKIRKSRGKNESRIHEFKVSYDPEIYKDEFPANMVWVGGFEFSPRPPGNVPFYQEVDPPSSKGFELRYFSTGLFSVFAKGSDELEFSKDYLSSWGLDKPEYYKEAHTDPFRVPQSVPDFVRIIHYLQGDPPEWINVNKLHKRPPLFQWDSFEALDITAHLKEGPLELPGIGKLNFVRNKASRDLKALTEKLQKMEKGDEYDKLQEEIIKLQEQTTKLVVHGDTKKLSVSLVNPELSSAELSSGRFKVELKGLTAEGVSVDLPPLKKLGDEMKKGLKPQFHLKGLHADKLTFTDTQTGGMVTLTNSNIASLDLLGPDSFQMSGVTGEKFEINKPGSGLTFSVKGPQISSATFKKSGDDIQVGITSVGGDEINLGVSGAQFKTNKSVLTNLEIIDSPNSTQVKAGGVDSSGSIEYKTPDGSFSLSTAGNSNLKGIELKRTILNSGETEIQGSLGLSGTIKKLNVSQNGIFSSQLSDTTVSEGELKLTARISADTPPKLTGLKYRLETKIDQATIDQAKIKIIELDPSKITRGHLLVEHDDWDIHTVPKMDISGTLDLHLKQMVGKDESFNLPGLKASGTIKGISVTGDAHFVWNNGEWLLERQKGDKVSPLAAQAQVEDAEIIQDPHLIPGNDLKKWPANHVVKSSLKIKQATFRIGDVERIEFSPDTTGTKRTSSLKQILVHDVAIENIEAGGVLWAKFPLFYYLRGLFPKIGSVRSGPSLKPSFIKLGDFEMSLDGGNPVTILRNFNTELYEVGGRDQYAKVRLPFLKITPFSPKLVDTGGEQIQLDVSLKDPPRGGSFQFKSVPRPLDERRSRVEPLPPATKSP